MCAALLKMKKRATTSSTRSKDWRQLHTLVHASILHKYGYTVLLHVSVKLRRLQACAAMSGMQRRATMSSTRSKHWCQSHSAAHARGPRNLVDTCNSPVQPYLRSIGACTSVCNWHQSFDLVKLIVALFFIFNNAAHICVLNYFTKFCFSLGRPHLYSHVVWASQHDR